MSSLAGRGAAPWSGREPRDTSALCRCFPSQCPQILRVWLRTPCSCAQCSRWVRLPCQHQQHPASGAGEYWGTSHHKARHQPHIPQSHLLKVAPCWQGALEAQGSHWAMGQALILGSNTFVAGQMLCVCLTPTRLGPRAASCAGSCCCAEQPAQLEAAPKGCSEGWGGGPGPAQHMLGCCPSPCRVLLHRISVPTRFSTVPSAAGMVLSHRVRSTRLQPATHHTSTWLVLASCCPQAPRAGHGGSVSPQAGSSLPPGLESLDTGPSHLGEEEELLGRVG